ncbi:MAG: DUF3189 family protein [Candidatus Syntrophopropionicum ammoniitolerans]
MKILYLSGTMFPLAVLAGAIHTGRLSREELPGRNQLGDLLCLDIKGQEGELIFLGKDDAGNKVYALSIKGQQDMIHRLMGSFLRIYNIQEAEVKMVDSALQDNIFLQLGKLLFRFAPLATVGYLLSRIGMKKIYSELGDWALAVKRGSYKSSLTI